MTLASSGEISLGGSTATRSINLELGQAATATISLNDANVRTLAGVASGAIVVPTDFYGKSNVLITFSDYSVFAAAAGTSEAAYAIFGAGSGIGKVYEALNGGAYTFVEQWCTPTSQGGNYEVYASVLAGSLSAGTTGSWVATTANPGWSVSISGSGNSAYCQLGFQVRRTGTGTVLDTWTVDLNADAL
jgi:hypothetical protein